MLLEFHHRVPVDDSKVPLMVILHADNLVAVSLANANGMIVGRIGATPEHPFFTPKGEVKAGETFTFFSS